MKKLMLYMSILMLINSAFAITPEQLLEKVQQQKNKIKTFQAIMITKINSPMIGKEMIQKATYYKKGEDKVRIEMITPSKMTTVHNGSNIFTIDEHGNKRNIPSNLSKQQTSKSPEDYLNEFNLSVEDKNTFYLVTGEPKDSSSIFKGMEFYINKEDVMPLKMIIKNKDNQEMMISTMEYKEVEGISVMNKNATKINMHGQKMDIDVTYKMIKINHELSDSLFE